MFENITVETKDFVTYITINRPSQLNALNKQTIQDLNLALQNCEADSNTGVIILTGSGEKAFVAGADIKEFADFTIAEGGFSLLTDKKFFLIMSKISQTYNSGGEWFCFRWRPRTRAFCAHPSSKFKCENGIA